MKLYRVTTTAALRRAGDISIRELITAAGPTSVLAGGAAYHHLFSDERPALPSHAPPNDYGGSQNDYYNNDRAGSSVP